jgi:hypothetical protein
MPIDYGGLRSLTARELIAALNRDGPRGSREGTGKSAIDVFAVADAVH